MQKIIFRASVISIGSLAFSQLIRFFGNIFLARLLAPSAFGVVGVVNMIILGLSMMSDLGLRQVVIQRHGSIEKSFLDTIWTIQIVRGIGIWFVAVLAAVLLRLLQLNGLIADNVYADPTLPFLIAAAASSAVFGGFESTKTLTARRDLDLGRVTLIALGAQIASMGTMIAVAHLTASPWALIAGAITTATLQCFASHILLPGEKNRLTFDRNVANEVLQKSKWILVSTPLSFFQSSAEVMILGGLVNSMMLGNYVIAYLLANVLQQVTGNLAWNVFFPGLSAAARESINALKKNYLRFQLFSDAIVVTAAGALMSAGTTVVSVLFDQRYTTAGDILSCLAIGLVGSRYYVIDMLMQAQGNFKLGTVISFLRLISLTFGTYFGFQVSGLTGAAIGVGLSWFIGWPVLIWFRSKTIPWPWLVECAAIGFLVTGYGVGLILNQIIHLIRENILN
jgi:O-antigen/teichoic acid export membrane protein